MPFRPVLQFTFLASASLLSSCHRDADNMGCRIAEINEPGTVGHYKYYYNSGRFVSLKKFDRDRIEEHWDVTYNSANQVATIQHIYPNSDSTGRVNDNYMFEYGVNGKPKKMYQTGPNTDTTVAWVTNYQYDGKDRLTTRDLSVFGIPQSRDRFEYDENNNVTAVYFTLYNSGPNTPPTTEKVGHVTSAFDNHPRFFANAPGLDVLEICVFSYIPSEHNPLATTWSMDNAYVSYIPPFNLTYLYSYNAEGLVESINCSTDLAGGFTFRSAKYGCNVN